MMRSLIWKEWHEQRWKLAFGCVILTSYAAIALRTRLMPDEVVMWQVVGVGLLMLPLLTAMGLIAPERTEGSYGTLRALPLSPSRVLAVKTLMGVLVCVVPLAAAAIVTLLVAGEREVSLAGTLGFYGRAALVAVVLLMWFLAFGVNLPTEARVGLIGLGLLVCWLLATLGLAAWVSEGWDRQQPLNAAPLAISPFGVLIPDVFWPLAVAVQLAIAAALWLWCVMRFARDQGDRL